VEDLEFPDDYDEIQLMDGVYLLDAGLCRTQNDSSKSRYGEPMPIIGPNGLAITQPALLDGDGQQLLPDSDGYLDPQYLFFRTRRRVLFAPMFTSGLGGLI
jgi:hypothetical protein